MKEHKLNDKFNPKDFEEKFIKIGRKRNILSQVKIEQKNHIQ